MTWTASVGWGLALVLCVVPAAGQEAGVAGATGATGATESKTIEVRMVDRGPTRFEFEPSSIQVRPGDRVVWIQAGVMPHNVAFTGVPEGSGVAGLSSEYLTMRGQRYELEIDGRFRPGSYAYVCTPHATMGMTGTIEVVASKRE